MVAQIAVALTLLVAAGLMVPSRPSSHPAPMWLTIVGVVANAPTTALVERSPFMHAYMPMSLARRVLAPGAPRGPSQPARRPPE